MASRQQWSPFCNLHKHTNKDQTWNCDHILGKQLFKHLYGKPEYKTLKVLWDSPYNKQTLPPHANTCVGLLCQRAWLWYDQDRPDQGGGRFRSCYCLDCALARLREGKALNQNLRQGLEFLKNPRDGSLFCYKASLCRSLRDLHTHYPEYKQELRRIKKRVRPLVCCRYGKFSSFCTRCALPRPSCLSSSRQKKA